MKATGGWIPPPVNSYYVQPPPPPPPAMTLAPTMLKTFKPTMIDIRQCLPRKIYSASLTKNERKPIMKKQKHNQENINLNLNLKK